MVRVAIFFNFIVIGFLCGGINCNKVFISPPKGFVFQPQDTPIENQDVHKMVQFVMGLPVEKSMSWKGMKTIDIFHPPKANILLELSLPDDRPFTVKYNPVTYEMENHPMHISPAAYINQALLQDYKEENVLMVDFHTDGQMFNLAVEGELDVQRQALTATQIQLSHSDSVSSFIKTPVHYLNESSIEILTFFGELQGLYDILNSLKKDGVNSDRVSLSFELSSLKQLADKYGPKSNEVEEAVLILEKFITDYIQEMEKIFNGNLLSEVIISTRTPGVDKHIRVARSLLQTPSETTSTYVLPNSPNYAVVFNISLWFMIIFALAILAASYALWFMDPGQDSIIYRMTNQRMKMD